MSPGAGISSGEQRKKLRSRLLLYALGIGVLGTALPVVMLNLLPKSSDGGMLKRFALDLLTPGGMVGLWMSRGRMHAVNSLLLAVVNIAFYFAVAYLLLAVWSFLRTRKKRTS